VDALILSFALRAAEVLKAHPPASSLLGRDHDRLCRHHLLALLTESASCFVALREQRSTPRDEKDDSTDTADPYESRKHGPPGRRERVQVVGSRDVARCGRNDNT
jgi:hypothetical protein